MDCSGCCGAHTTVTSFLPLSQKRLFIQKFREQSETRGELSGYAEELVGGQRIVKAFGYEQRAQETFEEINARLYDCGVKAQFYSSLTNPCTRFVNAMVYAAVGVCGAIAALRGGLTIGQLSAFLQYANRVCKALPMAISGAVHRAANRNCLPPGAVFSEVLDSPDETPDPADAVVMAESKGQVNLHDVSFSYHPGKRFIEALNLYANPGQRIAIVGPTGCGKTTIINLLMRFYDVDAGEILVDDVDIRHITRASLRGQFGMVLQDTWLFAGTVRENIAYGRPDATQEQVAAAAKAAHAHSFIKRLAQGYDTVLAEDGGNLSQGQRQLLSIARVMLTDPPMLILDEATSSIDTRTGYLRAARLPE
ncbi:MAG: ABC transporter ATP-binding protein [Acutalibacteraceae bacterium]